eukprot:1318052-Prymnesium_polylepis.1
MSGDGLIGGSWRGKMGRRGFHVCRRRRPRHGQFVSRCSSSSRSTEQPRADVPPRHQTFEEAVEANILQVTSGRACAASACRRAPLPFLPAGVREWVTRVAS